MILSRYCSLQGVRIRSTQVPGTLCKSRFKVILVRLGSRHMSALDTNVYCIYMSVNIFFRFIFVITHRSFLLLAPRASQRGRTKGRKESPSMNEGISIISVSEE